MHSLLKPLVWMDRAVNVLIGGSFRETLSARAHRMDVKNHPYWGWTAAAINTLFFWQEDHCKTQWEDEQAHPLTGEMLPRDKVLHFGAGFGIALLAGWLLLPWMGLLFAGCAAVVKELYDYLDPEDNKADFLDLLVTLLGGWAGMIFLLYL